MARIGLAALAALVVLVVVGGGAAVLRTPVTEGWAVGAVAPGAPAPTAISDPAFGFRADVLLGAERPAAAGAWKGALPAGQALELRWSVPSPAYHVTLDLPGHSLVCRPMDRADREEATPVGPASVAASSGGSCIVQLRLQQPLSAMAWRAEPRGVPPGEALLGFEAQYLS